MFTAKNNKQLVNEDGVEIKLAGITRERCLEMYYQDRNVRFEFLATRYEPTDFLSGDIPIMDRWLVILSCLNADKAKQFASLHGDSEESARNRIKENISDALLAWPITPITPSDAKTVIFAYEP